MTALTLDLPPKLYERLRLEAQRQSTSTESMVQAWLTERLAAASVGETETKGSDRDYSTAALRAAGLLTEPGPAMKERAARSRATLDEVSEALSRPGSKPLSEIILEQRGPKE